MAVINRFIVCPINCASSPLTALAVKQDCISPANFFKSKITTVWLLPKTSAAGVVNPLPAAMTAAAFLAVTDNADLLGVKMKNLSVEGAIGSPVKSTKKFRDTDYTYNNKYNVEVSTISMDAQNYEFFRNLQCGGFVGYAWFGTQDHIFGGFSLTDGANRIIELDNLQSDIELPTGDDALQTGKLTLSFNALTMPPRYTRFV